MELLQARPARFVKKRGCPHADPDKAGEMKFENERKSFWWDLLASRRGRKGAELALQGVGGVTPDGWGAEIRLASRLEADSDRRRTFTVRLNSSPSTAVIVDAGT